MLIKRTQTKTPCKGKSETFWRFTLPGRYALIDPNTTNGGLDMVYRGFNPYRNTTKNNRTNINLRLPAPQECTCLSRQNSVYKPDTWAIR